MAMNKIISVFLCVLSFSNAAVADEVYNFECRAKSVQGNGDISELLFSEEGAAIDGAYLDAAEVSAFDNQNIVGSVNKYVNGKEARILIASVVKADLQMSYDGYPHDDPTHIVSNIYNVELSVENEEGTIRKFFGTCSERYQGD
jgi:hypothetical protein